MKVPMRFEFDEDTRRRIRARVGKAGIATRADVRAFVDLVVAAAVEVLDPPRRRGDGTTGGRRGPERGKDSEPPRAPTTAAETVSETPEQLADSADSEVPAEASNPICRQRNCGRPKSEHSTMGWGCPGMKLYQHGDFGEMTQRARPRTRARRR
jgi:hypothetical protein